MTKQVMLNIPEKVYAHVERVAIAQKTDVEAILEKTIQNSFYEYPAHPERAQMEQEIEAYYLLHAELVKNFLGQHIAIYQGLLIDNDESSEALNIRIMEKYPDKIVLQRKVQEDPEPIIYMRSPRLERF
ncbi:MAG: hypothetical protein AAF639_09435 [Chloroflexota bacterium]